MSGTEPGRPLRYALSGAGTRAGKLYLPQLGPALPERLGSLVAVVDTDQQRLDAAVATAGPVPAYRTADLAGVLAQARADVLVVCTPDHVHAEQIEAGLAARVSVFSEKPMTVTCAQALSVLAAQRDSASWLRVAHNLRFLNLNRRIKQLLDQGRIGRPLTVSFGYRLTAGHGHSYFTRWHRRMAASGGLQVTKSCHHFDLCAWWLSDRPVQVSGWTARNHYRGPLDPPDGRLPVPADADIDDTVEAVIRYRGGALVHYSLSARSSWEGYAVTVSGTDGELVARYEVVPPAGRTLSADYRIELTTARGREVVSVAREPGTHSGADAHLIRALLHPPTGADLLQDAATGLDGAYAVAVGEAVSRSAAGGQPVLIADLLAGSPPADDRSAGNRQPLSDREGQP